MDLQALNSGPTPTQKIFLNPIVGTLTAGTVKSGPSLAPAVYSQYSQTSDVAVGNTVLGSISAGATHVGTLTIPPLPFGAVVKMTAYGITSTTTASANFALYIDGKQATAPTGSVGTPTIVASATRLTCYFTVKNPASSCDCFVDAYINGISNVDASDVQLNINYDNTVSHQFDLFASFSAAAVGNSFTCSSFFVELSNA
jgi:hypothetical protein